MYFWICFCLHFCTNQDKRKLSKLILRFNRNHEKKFTMKDIIFTKEIKKALVPDNQIILTKGELDDIFLSEKALCVIFRNLELLKNSDKLKNVFLEKVAIYKNNRDPWNKLTFYNKIDATGYFHGVYTKNFKLSESMFFHDAGIDEETSKKNVISIRKILYYIGVLKKKSVHEVLKEECQLEQIDLIIFKNLYKFNKNENIKVCICRDLECSICGGVYDTKRSVL